MSARREIAAALPTRMPANPAIHCRARRGPVLKSVSTPSSAVTQNRPMVVT